jgi:hypothetical protein
VAYDLNKIFALKGMKMDQEISEGNLTIAADSFLLSSAYKRFETFRKCKQRMADGERVNIDSLVAANSESYHAYVLAGDYLYKQEQFQRALHFYKTALTKEIATKKEQEHINNQIQKCLHDSRTRH